MKLWSLLFLVHDDDFAWQAQYFGCLMFKIQTKNVFRMLFNVNFSWCAAFGEIPYVLTQPSRRSVRLGSLSLWRGAYFDIARATPSHFLRLGRLSLWRPARLSRFLEILEKERS